MYLSTEDEVSVVTIQDGQSTDEAVVEALADAASLQGTIQELVLFEVEVGSGTEVTEGSTVTVHYAGNTQEGVQFDNSYERGEPFTFTLGEGKVIEGWEQGLTGMKEGGRRALVIPARMAYGSRQVGPIPPNSTLVFIVEVLEVR
ncbi:FKBP-type peptidyl-prolyl cis-trans isomerase [Candidatus Kaiserbacteria bacterium]|nr:FKBP-type peptidyl-prolyl cis-trans isomerase [Candidatus Kaiserbacteria bacterium]